MKKNISGGVAAAIIAVVAILIVLFGYRYISGGPDADVTKQNIEHWKNAKSGAPGGIDPKLSH
jgi:hypothetical protein